MEKDTKACRTMLKGEAKEHAALWRSPQFRHAVKKEERKEKRPAMGKR